MVRHKHRRRARAPHQSSLAIRDPRALGDLLRDAVAIQGGQAQAARESRISQPTLSRLIAGTRTRVHRLTVARLRTIVPSSKRDALRAALESPWTPQVLGDYQRWLAKQVDGLSGGDRRGRWEIDAETGDGSVVTLVEEFTRLKKTVRREFPAVCDAFDHLCWGRVLPKRIELAYWRILGPLLPDVAAGLGQKVELGYRDLRDSDHQALRQFVEAGFRRETILIGHRDGDMRRAEQIAESCEKPGRGRLSGTPSTERERRRHKRTTS